MSIRYRTTFQLRSGQIHDGTPLLLLAHTAIGSLAPIRQPNNFKGQKHITGLYYSPTTGRQHAFESRLEQKALTRVDFELSPQAIATQPFALLYDDGDKRRGHIPDILVQLQDARPLVIDVKPKAFVEMNKVPFSAMREACNEIGWTYAIWTEMHPTYWHNLSFLYGYHRHSSELAVFAETLVNRLQDGPLTIRQVLEDFVSPSLVRTTLFHLMWRRRIQANLAERLHDDAVLHLGA
ncbi:TnsA-like heteromeric transposase endonuclease subunit [Deinococcus sp. HMF7604]|uniref:TnsA-like heteromeric transposase endonuclease subunit n=1 Tax=Deinococcus betulae TaxID=2873312 RepID=UPI001CCB5D20|nr:TnsA-like heteromeric transposase endonuclease subunit [Deinococcus betulae]MBZ9753632.1 TnsA-like heteromeric transposase endonuclease subunit [Deinococcus betulae]